MPTLDAPVSSTLELIGNTPMIKITHLDTGSCELFLKLECQNPGGSIKDRIGLSMIEAAEKSGALKPGGTIIEATAGNTGLGLALVASQKGYNLILVIPDKMSQDKIIHLRALGADVRLTRSDVAKGHPDYYQDMASRLSSEIEGSFFVNQFGNPANPYAHETGTGPEIWEQMSEKVDAIVAGVGSGGTISGLAKFFKSVNPDIDVVLADPEGSVVAEAVWTGTPATEVGSWVVEGIGEDFIPDILALDLVDKAYLIPDQEALEVVREILASEGLLLGSSSGTLIGAALRYCHEQTTPKRVVTIAADTGNKYLSKAFNDYWMEDQGFIKRDKVGDIRDLISRRKEDRAIVTVGQDDSLLTAYGRMKLYDVSQLPVMDADEKLVGIIDEMDILMKVSEHEDRFSEPVSAAMATNLKTLPPSAEMEDLIPIFNQGMVVIIEDDEGFHGIITRIDVVNFLRAKLRDA